VRILEALEPPVASGLKFERELSRRTVEEQLLPKREFAIDPIRIIRA
jgi:hypothetical protein